MEFYELNRYYDKQLPSYDSSKSLDYVLYYLYPMIISFGVVISSIEIIALAQRRIYITSKLYLLTQSITIFLFQFFNIFIFVTNSYEQKLHENSSLRQLRIYLNLKIYVSYIYNSLFYLIIWFFLINTFDFCMILVIQPKYDDLLNDDDDEDEEEEDVLNTSSGQGTSANHDYHKYIDSVDRTGCVLNVNTSHRQSSTQSSTKSRKLSTKSNKQQKQAEKSASISKFMDPNDYKKLILINKTEAQLCKVFTVRKMIFFFYIFAFVFALPSLFSYGVNQTNVRIVKKPMKLGQQSAAEQRRISALNSMGAFTIINLANNKTVLLKNSEFIYKISTVHYHYCNILNTGSNEYRSEDNVAGGTPLANPPLAYLNITLVCINHNSNLTSSLLANTLYFWLMHTFCIFLPFLMVLIFASLLIYIFRNRENFYQNYYYFLNRHNSLQDIVTLKSLIFHYQLPEEDLKMLNKKFNFLINERYSMTIMYFINLFVFLLFMLPYIMFRLVLDIFMREKQRLSLDFYILYKLLFLFFHFSFIIRFFLLLLFSYKFRLSIFKAFTCKHCCCCFCCCCYNKGTRLFNKLFYYFGFKFIWFNTPDGGATTTMTTINNHPTIRAFRADDDDGDDYEQQFYGVKDSTKFDVDKHKFCMPANPAALVDNQQTVTVVVSFDNDEDENVANSFI